MAKRRIGIVGFGHLGKLETCIFLKYPIVVKPKDYSFLNFSKRTLFQK
jgi:hypothetical protein